MEEISVKSAVITILLACKKDLSENDLMQTDYKNHCINKIDNAINDYVHDFITAKEALKSAL